MKHIRRHYSFLEKHYVRMATMDRLGGLSLLGATVGVLAALIIVAFRLLVEAVQVSFLPGANPENYEALGAWARFLLPVGGAFFIGLVFQAVEKSKRQTGPVHVMERLAYYQANLPTGNAIMQFFGAATAIITGQSVGREGPAIHLGATAGSRLGQWLHLPNNANRKLVACGIAAAIAASFNTPLAGVIFSMEVIIMEYSVTSFIPVILASVSATMISRMVFGQDPAFTVPPLQLGNLFEMPYVLLAGLVIGCLAALFIQTMLFFTRTASEQPVWLRTTAGGIIVGLCAVAMPQIMGIGYDTVNEAMVGQLGAGLLMGIMLVKLFATAAGLGLGLPGGLIGPTLVIGACAGAAIGETAALLSPNATSSPGLYAMIGMGAMMGATLQAPLAALTALLELTANPNIILPGMLAIVSASLVNGLLFRRRSIFIMLMRARGLDYRHHPVAQSLRRTSCAKAMDRDIAILPTELLAAEGHEALQSHPHWVVVRQEEGHDFILPGADLAGYLEANPDTATINLADIPGQHRQADPIDLRATLQEALDHLNQSGTEALYVVNTSLPGPIYGILTREDIEEHYRYPGLPRPQ